MQTRKQSKLKQSKLKQSRKNKRLQKGGANYTMSNFNDGRLPRGADVFVPDRNNPYPPNIAGGRWYQTGFTRDNRPKYQWWWDENYPRCGDGVGWDDRLWCANRGFNQAAKDNWCSRQRGCLRCANSGYCTHTPLQYNGPMVVDDDGGDWVDSDVDDDGEEDDSDVDADGWQRVPNEVWEPQDSDQALEYERRRREQEVRNRRSRLPCNPIPRTCEEARSDAECLGGRCALCENNEDIDDPIYLDTIPTGKGVCIDAKCYNSDHLEEHLRKSGAYLPHNRKSFSIAELNSALQQVICTGDSRPSESSSSRDPGPSSSRDTGPSSSEDYSMNDIDSEIEELQEQAELIKAQLISLPPIQALEEEIITYRRIYKTLVEERERYIEQYTGIVPDHELLRAIEDRETNLIALDERVSRLERELNIQKQQKQELQDSQMAIIIALQDLARTQGLQRLTGHDGGKKYRKNTKKYKNKKIKTNKKRLTRKKYR